MKYLAYRDSAGSHVLSGSQYVNPTAGTARLNIRTGTESNDILKYGWTTNSSATAYCPIRAVIYDGTTAYIGRSNTYTDTLKKTYDITCSISTKTDITATRQSDVTATRKSDVTATRESNYTVSTRSSQYTVSTRSSQYTASSKTLSTYNNSSTRTYEYGTALQAQSTSSTTSSQSGNRASAASTQFTTGNYYKNDTILSLGNTSTWHTLTGIISKYSISQTQYISRHTRSTKFSIFCSATYSRQAESRYSSTQIFYLTNCTELVSNGVGTETRYTTSSRQSDVTGTRQSDVTSTKASGYLSTTKTSQYTVSTRSSQYTSTTATTTAITNTSSSSAEPVTYTSHNFNI